MKQYDRFIKECNESALDKGIEGYDDEYGVAYNRLKSEYIKKRLNANCDLKELKEMEERLIYLKWVSDLWPGNPKNKTSVYNTTKRRDKT